MAPRYSSLAVAPGSTYVVPSSTVCVLSPFNVITGGITSLKPSSVKLFMADTPAMAINALWITLSSALIFASAPIAPAVLKPPLLSFSISSFSSNR